MSQQTYQVDPNLQSAQEALTAAKLLAGPLIDSPSQNEAKRRDLVGILQKTDSLLVLIGKLAVLSWSTEADAFTTTLASIKKLCKEALEQKVLSWKQINEAIAALTNTLSQNKLVLQAKSEKESRALVSEIQEMISSFKPAEPITDADWKRIDEIFLKIQNNRDKASGFPAAPLAPWNAPEEIATLAKSCDSVIARTSGSLANNLESVTSQIGLRPQSGRKTAIWMRSHQWYLLGVIAALSIISWKVMKK